MTKVKRVDSALQSMKFVKNLFAFSISLGTDTWDLFIILRGENWPCDCGNPPCDVCLTASPSSSPSKIPSAVPTFSAPTTSPVICGTISAQCQIEVDWAMNTGRFENTASQNYDRFTQITGSSLANATSNDMLRYFKCIGLKTAECGTTPYPCNPNFDQSRKMLCFLSR